MYICGHCGNPVEGLYGLESLCCGEVNHAEWIDDVDSDDTPPVDNITPVSDEA